MHRIRKSNGRIRPLCGYHITNQYAFLFLFLKNASYNNIFFKFIKLVI